MPFTDRSSIFASVDEKGINRLIRHVMRQRPSLFNYATAAVADSPQLWCSRFEVAADVDNFDNPYFSIEDPVPIVGTDGAYSLNFIAQVTKLEIDFHPGNVVALPPQLGALGAQRMAFHGQVCAGLCCPADLGRQTKWPGHTDKAPDKRHGAVIKPDPIVFPCRELECFCLDLYLVAHFDVTGPAGAQQLVGRLDGIEIVDIKPDPLESAIECYLRLLVTLVLFPKLSAAVNELLNSPLNIFDLASVTHSFTPTTPALPNNPAIEDDKLKVFIDIEVSS